MATQSMPTLLRFQNQNTLEIRSTNHSFTALTHRLTIGGNRAVQVVAFDHRRDWRIGDFEFFVYDTLDGIVIVDLVELERFGQTVIGTIGRTTVNVAGSSRTNSMEHDFLAFAFRRFALFVVHRKT
jgi:hypothetical protein